MMDMTIAIMDEGRVVSWCDLHEYDKLAWMLVSDVCTIPEYRRKGLMTELMRSAKDIASDLDKGLYLFVKQCNRHAIAAYEKSGFRLTSVMKAGFVMMACGDKDMHALESIDFCVG